MLISSSIRFASFPYSSVDLPMCREWEQESNPESDTQAQLSMPSLAESRMSSPKPLLNLGFEASDF